VARRIKTQNFEGSFVEKDNAHAPKKSDTYEPKYIINVEGAR